LNTIKFEYASKVAKSRK